MVDLPKIEAPIKIEIDGKEYWAFTTEEKNKIKELRIAANANLEIAAKIQQANQYLESNRNIVRELALLEERRANLFAEKYFYTDQALKDERFNRKLDQLLGISLLFLLSGI